MRIRFRRYSWATASLALAAVSLTVTTVLSELPASARKLPNACSILSAVRPQNTIGASTHASAGTYKPSNSIGYSGCYVKVGTITVTLYLSAGPGGSGGVRVTSTTHPSGLGTGDNLVIGVGAGSRAPVDYITFHRGGIYASINANGTKPSALTALAREVYPKI